jgi:hypothetical protein
MMLGLSREVRYSAALLRYLNGRIESCYFAPIIWVFAPKNRGVGPRQAHRPHHIAEGVAATEIVAVAVRRSGDVASAKPKPNHGRIATLIETLPAEGSTVLLDSAHRRQ